ncbi:hypothetical protein ACHAXT_007128 [Thalassiosira profunda]
MAGLQPLRHHLRQHASRLRASPVLLVSSAPPPAVSTAVAGTKSPSAIAPDAEARQAQHAQLKLQQQQTDPRVRAFVERNAQSLASEFNLRTVPCAIHAAFPTVQSVEEAVALAKRAGLKEGSFGSGDGTIVGIGSGAAMDLAKAVADTLFGDVAPSGDDDMSEVRGSLVLAPCTVGGMWAASSNAPSLLLDTKEEMLLPHLPPAWDGGTAGLARTGTIVARDPPGQLALPPLYTPFAPTRSGHPMAPSEAHVAGAMLAIVLDAARSLDSAPGTDGNNTAPAREDLTERMTTVAAGCAAVLECAAGEGEATDGRGRLTADEPTSDDLKRKRVSDWLSMQLPSGRLADDEPTLDWLMMQLSSIVVQAPIAAAGTVPQKLANVLLPSHFPQCHLITYLACILPGLCEVVVSTHQSSRDGASVTEQVMNEILQEGVVANDSSLSSWASRVSADAGIPSMASLAYGTPDVTALVGSVESYETLVASTSGGLASSSVQEDRFIEAVLQSSLNR